MSNEQNVYPVREEDIFQQCLYDDHQKGRSSPLLNIEAIQCNKSYVLTYMDLVYLDLV